jgi:spermidine synthase
MAETPKLGVSTSYGSIMVETPKLGVSISCFDIVVYFMNTHQIASHYADTPLGSLCLTLRYNGDKLDSAALIFDGMFLMDSEAQASEIALATRGMEVLSELSSRSRKSDLGESWRVLVGGLGLGLTLQALLKDPRIAQVIVIELFAQVIEWNRDLLGPLNGYALADSRVVIIEGDVIYWFTGMERRTDGMDQRANLVYPSAFCASSLGSDNAFDLILLDIDNGPNWLSLPSNSELYELDNLNKLRDWLTACGLVIFWASDICVDFEHRLDALDWGQWSREQIQAQPVNSTRSISTYLYLLHRRV